MIKNDAGVQGLPCEAMCVQDACILGVISSSAPFMGITFKAIFKNVYPPFAKGGDGYNYFLEYT